MILFDEPKLKRNYYLATTQQPVTHDIIDATVKKITRLEGDKGYLLSIYIGKNDQSIFDSIDNESLQSLIDNNNNWFNNDLGSNEISGLFKRAVCEQNNLINVYLTEKSQILVNGVSQDTSSELSIISDSIKLKQYTLNLKLRLSGMYIYSSHTINKWCIKSLHMYSIEDDDVDREEINNFWFEQIKECQETLENRKKIIEDTQKKLDDMYSKTIDMDISNKEWEKKLSEIKQIIQNIIFL